MFIKYHKQQTIKTLNTTDDIRPIKHVQFSDSLILVMIQNGF